MGRSRYQPVRRLAIGGMGDIVLAKQLADDDVQRLVALKSIRPDLSSDDRFQQLFRNEARVAARLSHPNIVHVYDFGVENGECFLALEYVPGRTLFQMLRRCSHIGTMLPMETVIAIALDVARALHYAHELKGDDDEPLNIVHRDISPSNVIVSLEGDAKILDFGVAKASIAEDRTERQSLKGHLNYLSPEQVKLEKVDRRADIYGLGILLWEMTTGIPLYQIRNHAEAVEMVGRDALPDHEELRRAPPGWEGMLRRALAPRREERYPTARELQRDLEEVARSAGYMLSNLTVVQTMAHLFPEAALSTPAPTNRRPTALAVDDEEPLRQLLVRSLRRTYQVETASSVGEAMDMLAAAPFDVVISDERMPDGRGVDLLTHVATTSPGTARVMITAYAEPDLMLKAINRGHVHRFLTKPFRPPELLGVIDDLMSERQWSMATDSLVGSAPQAQPQTEAGAEFNETPLIPARSKAGAREDVALSDVVQAPPTQVGTSFDEERKQEDESRIELTSPEKPSNRPPSMPTDSFPWHGVRALCMPFRRERGDALLFFGISSQPFDERQVERLSDRLAKDYPQHFSHVEGRQLAVLIPETDASKGASLSEELIEALADPRRGFEHIAMGHALLGATADIVELGHDAEMRARTEFVKEVGRV